MKKVIVKPESLKRVNILRIDDIYIPREYFKLGKEYEVIEERIEKKVIKTKNFKTGETSVAEENVTRYFLMETEFETEEVLASDFEEVKD